MAGVACVIILALIIAAIVLLSNEKKIKKYRLPQAEGLSLDDVILGRLNPKSFNATWISGKLFKGLSPLIGLYVNTQS